MPPVLNNLIKPCASLAPGIPNMKCGRMTDGQSLPYLDGGGPHDDALLVLQRGPQMHQSLRLHRATLQLLQRLRCALLPLLNPKYNTVGDVQAEGARHAR